MKVDRHEMDGATVVLVSELKEVDVASADAFKEAVLKAMGEASKVVIDVSTIEFFDSAGMRVLLSIKKHIVQRNGKLVLAGLNRPARDIFRMVGFDVIFLIYPDIPQAVAALKS
jgi:anti-anti-sigma factor